MDKSYETGEGLFQEDNETYLEMAIAGDLVQFEEVVKVKIERAIDAEMEAIHKTNTLE